MASASGNWSGDSRFSLIMNVNESFVSDGASNYSNVDWNLQLSSTSPYRTYTGYAENPLIAYVDGQLVSNQNITYDLQNNTITVASGTVRVNHNSDGSKTIGFSASFTDNSNGKGSAGLSGTLVLTKIPRQANLTEAPNFNDEQNPTIKYTNSAGNSVTKLQAYIERQDTSATLVGLKDISKTGNSYTFNLTTAERNTLRNATPNSNTLGVRFVVKTVIGGNTYYSTMNRTLTIINANPTFSNFDFNDIDTTTLALTNNSKYNINNYSDIKATISTANKAVANKGATMKKYRFECGNSSTEANYSSNSEVNMTINNATTGTYKVYAEDSRGNSTLVTKFATSTINYTSIYLNKANSFVERDDSGVGGVATLHYEGSYWNNSFGSVTNTIKSVSYSFKKTTDSQYITGATDITPTITGSTFTFEDEIKSNNPDYTFDIESSYNVRVVITDELSTYTIDLILNSGTPNIAYCDEGVAIMQDYDDDRGGALQVGGHLKFDAGDNDRTIEWKERGWGDKFRLSTIFGGGGDSNRFKIQGTTGAAGTDPDTWKDLFVITAENGNAFITGNLTVNGRDITNTYSTTEKKIGTWIDNKPIYRKVIQFTGLTTGTAYNKSFANCGISNVDSIIKLEGYEYSSNWFIPLSEYNGFNNYLYVQSASFAYKTGWASNIRIIIEYTKTTD